MEFKKIVENIIGNLLIWSFRIFVIIFLFCVTVLAFKYVFFTESGSFNVLRNENITSVLIIVLAFATAISIFYYRVINAEIKKSTEKKFKRERNLSAADNRICLGYFHMHIYKEFYSKKTKSKKAEEEINSAIFNIRRALEYLDEIEKKEGKDYFDILYLAKNNYAYYLARKWDYYKGKRNNKSFKGFLEKDGEIAREYNVGKIIAKECVDYLKKENVLEKYPATAHRFLDTFLWVERVFEVKVDIKKLL